jgi:DNA-binding response OmpR family regulator
MTRVLLVEDDASLGRTLAERLEREQVSVRWVRSVGEAKAEIAAGAWQLAIVDVTLPDGSGFGLARQIRKETATPVMFMTALNSAESRLEGFEIGAEEYLPKPFHLKEFIIRVRLLLARQRPPDPLRVGRLVLDFDAMSVESPETGKVFLQVRDSRVLKLLVDSAPRVVNRSEILDRVWGEDHFPTPRAVDNAIVRLRQALGDTDAQLIRSVRGVGYQWAGASQA